MKYLLLLGLLISSLRLSAQPATAFRWTNQVPLSYPSLALDGFGNTVVTGSFSQTITVNGQSVVPYGTSDVFIGKYSATGRLLWFTHVGGASANAQAADVALDAAGNVYAAGVFNGTLTQNVAGTPLTVSGDIFSGSYLLPFLLKLSPAGQTLWARQGKDNNGFIQSSSGVRVAVDPLGNATITGYGTSLLTFGSITLGNASRSAFVVHYDAAGTVKWGHTVSSALFAASRGIGADAAGNTHLTISLQGPLFLDGQSIPIPESTTIVLAKLNGNSGALLSTVPIIGIENTDLAVDLLGHSTLIGSFSGTARFGNKSLTSSSPTEVYAARYHPDGSLDWVRSLGAYDPFSARIATNPTGSSIIALLNPVGSSAHAQLLEMNTHSGAITWRQELGPGTTSGSNLAVSPAEQVSVAGGFTGRLTLGNTSHTSATPAFFLTRLDRGPRGNSPHVADLIASYPNPATAYLKLRLPKECLPARAALFHMSGREVLSQALTADETELNLRDIKPGLYTLRLQLPEGPVTQQIQVK